MTTPGRSRSWRAAIVVGLVLAAAPVAACSQPASGGAQQPFAATEPPRPAATAAPKVTAPPKTDVYYANCADARNAGAAPLHRGEPGYRSALDRDNDGIACE